MESDFLVEVSHLQVQFPVNKTFFLSAAKMLTVLDDIHFSMRKGESVGLVGESGSGKSTLAKAIAGLVPASFGEVYVGGVSMKAPTTSLRRLIAKKVQMVFQDPTSSLNPRKTVENTLCDSLLFHGEARDLAEAVSQAARLLETVGLSKKYLSRYPHQMSGGQLQRVAIAAALAPKPELIIFDEATSSLDVSVQAQILNLLADLKKQFSVSYLFISHDLAVVQNVCERTYVLYLGKILEIGGEELFTYPKHPYTEALLKAQPRQMPDEEQGALSLTSYEAPSLLHPPSGCVFRTRCPYAEKRCEELPPKKSKGGSIYYCILDR